MSRQVGHVCFVLKDRSDLLQAVWLAGLGDADTGQMEMTEQGCVKLLRKKVRFIYLLQQHVHFGHFAAANSSDGSYDGIRIAEISQQRR